MGACLNLLAPLAAQPQTNHPIALTEAAKAGVMASNRAPLPILSAKTSAIDLQNGGGCRLTLVLLPALYVAWFSPKHAPRGGDKDPA